MVVGARIGCSVLFLALDRESTSWEFCTSLLEMFLSSRVSCRLHPPHTLFRRSKAKK